MSKGALWFETKLEVIPESHTIHESNAVILKLVDVDLHTVLSNILQCLCMLSVQATCFDSPVKAILWTAENVQLELALWLTPSREGIVVEVKLLRGWKGTFQNYKRCILDAANGDFVSTECMQSIGEIDCLHLIKAEKIIGSEPEKRNEQEVASSLNIVVTLFKKKEPEATVIALETLCVLTDPRRMGVFTSLMAGLAVLTGVAPGQQDGTPFLEILDAILSILKGHSDKGFNWEPVNSLLPPTFLVLSLVLNVLCYALELFVTLESEGLDTSGEHASATEVVASFFAYALHSCGVDVVRFLLDLLEKAETAPHFACLSVKCLRFICISSQDACERVVKLGAVKAVNTAYNCGISCHSNLEKECARFQSILGK